MSAAASLHAPTGDAAELAEPQPAINDGDLRADAGLRVHDSSEQDDEQQAAHFTAHVSPAMRIYRHALESILSMLELQDLSHALSVSRSWSAAVRSMKPIGATIERDELQTKREGTLYRPLPPVLSLVACSLLRHLAAIHITDKYRRATPLTCESLATLSQHAPNLTSLWCDLTLTPDVPLSLPLKLTSLELTLADAYPDAEINSILTALAALPSLSRLALEVLPDGADVSLLAASRTLTDFTLASSQGIHRTLSDDHVAQIRSSLSHLTRIRVARMDHKNLPRFLQPPHSLRWQDIGSVTADARTGDLLATLPTLTKLELDYHGDAPHADFLSKLPLLSALKLYCGRHIPAAALLSSLLPCIGLTELDLHCGSGSSHVSPLFAVLASLRKLTLSGQLETLQCFTSGPATRTLEALYINQLDRVLPPSEIVHLYALQGLRSLELFRVFASLDESAMASLTPPTAHLPRLTRFAFTASWDQVERRGPSFEWTQQRLTQ